MKLHEIFSGKDLPVGVSVEKPSTDKYVFKVNLSKDNQLEYLMIFRAMGIKNLYDVNLYLISNGEMIQTLSGTGSSTKVLSARQWVLQDWLENKRGNASLHSYAEEPKRFRIYLRMFSQLSRSAEDAGLGKWKIAHDGEHEIIFARDKTIGDLLKRFTETSWNYLEG